MRRFVLAAVLFAGNGFAQRNMLDWVLPRGGTRGTTVDVTLHGVHLEDPKEILFYKPGIKALAFQKSTDKDVRVRFEIAPDCPLGEHVLRLRTATALTDAMTFWVSPFPAVKEQETKIGQNDTFDKAQPIALNSTIEGQIQPGPEQDHDLYRIEAKQGQRISVEVEAARLGTVHQNSEIDLAVALYDDAHKLIASNDDSALYVQDPVLSVMAPRDGSYFVEIQQKVYGFARMAYYRAHIGTFTRPTAIYPAGGTAGDELQVRVLGDPTGERTEIARLPKTPGPFDYFAGKPGEWPPSANTIRVSPYGNVLHIAGTAPTPVPSLPAALNGIITEKGQTDLFRFEAKKGQSWVVRVFGRSIGSPIDPRISVRAEKGGKNILSADDAKLTDRELYGARGTWYLRDTLDPAGVLQIPADGAYILAIADTRGLAGRDFVYRIEVEPAVPRLFTNISMQDGYQIPRLVGMIVPKGNRWTMDVQLAQGLGNTYKGDIELEAVGLPRGVKMIAPTFKKGAIRMPVQFVASDDAEQQAALVQLLARPADRKVKLQTGSRQSFALLEQPGQLPWHFVFLDRYAMAITQPAPFHIELEQPEIPLSQNGELLLKVKAIRHEGFKEKIEIQPDWLPPGVSKQGAITIPADKNEATFRIQASNKAQSGVYQIAMNATTTGGDGFSGVGRIRVSSEFVILTISEPYLTIDLKRTSVERGQPGQITGTIHPNKPFEGKATVTLKRLPKGVKMQDPAPQITNKDTEVTFQIQADQDALLGLYKELTCDVAVTENNQTIHQTTGTGILRVDPARTAVAK